MCSIIGWKGKFNPDVIKDLCDNSRIRGLHAFGYCFYHKGVLVVKKFLDYDSYLKSLLADKPNKFLAHFRYSTSGDYKNEINNQPLVRNNLAMVFNGVLDMRTKDVMEQFHSVSLISDNDGELALLKMLETKTEFYNFVKDKSFAGAFLTYENEIIAYRNSNRPAYIGYFEDAKILASTKDILTRSGIKKTEFLEQNKLISL